MPFTPPIRPIHAGMMAAPLLASGIPTLPQTANQLNRVIGFTPNHLYLLNDSSGNAVDEVGGATLTAGGTLDYGVATNIAGEVGIEFTYNTTDALTASASTVWDHQNEDWGIILVWQPVDGGSAARNLATKSTGSVHQLFLRWRDNDATVRQTLNDGTLNVASAVADPTAGDVCVTVVGVDRSADNQTIAQVTSAAALTSDTDSVSIVSDAATNSGSFALGNGGGITSSGYIAIWCALFGGANAAGFQAAAGTIAQTIFDRLGV